MSLGQDSPAAERMSRPLSRSELRKQIGPSNPLYGFLMQLAVQDLCPLYNEDFADQAVQTAIWDLDDSASTTALWAINADAASGELEMDLSATNDTWGRIQGVQNSARADHRPIAIFRFSSAAFDSDDDTLKVEAGFASALGEADNSAASSGGGGQIDGAKATPVSSIQDFSVVCLDTDDNIFWDVVGDDDGTTVTTNVTASVPWNPTDGAADLTNGDGVFQTIVCAQNENNEAYGWINGHFIGRLAAAAPDTGVAETVHFFIQNRAAADLGMIELDYIKAWQERSAIS